jgi:acyl carrier protein
MCENIRKINKNVREALATLSIPLDVETIGDNESLQDEYGLDSIVLMEFMIILEEKFFIEFDENISLETLNTISGVTQYINRINNYNG